MPQQDIVTRCSYDDPSMSARIFDLLDEVFPGIRRRAEQLGRLGAVWEEVSTPFVAFEGDVAISHVGVIDLPLMVDGTAVRAGTLHAVATRPTVRRRGFFRLVMEEVLRATEPRFDTLLLTTEHPEYFAPFGFECVAEHRFVLEVPGDLSSPQRPNRVMRCVRLDDPADLAMVHRLLGRRTPVSHVVGVEKEVAIFLFNEAHGELFYLDELDALLAMTRRGSHLVLHDVVCEQLPSLDVLLSTIGGPLSSVELRFAADRLAPEARPQPWLFEHDGLSHLMVRGRPLSARPFSLPRSART